MATTYKKAHKQNKGKHKHKESTTEEVFETLDKSASKAEYWIQRHSSTILSVVFLILLGGVGFFFYNKYTLIPKEIESGREMYFARNNYKKAIDAPENQKDSLYNIALEGDGDRYGLLHIIETYSGTDSENEAHYLAGISYIKLKKYKKAIRHLEEFDSDDMILGALALGAIGDAYANTDNTNMALEYYKKAFNRKENTFTSPRFLMKAAIIAMEMENNLLAETYLKKIKDLYPDFSSGNNIEALLTRVKNSNK